MAFRSFRHTLTSTPSKIIEAQAGDLEVWIIVAGGTGSGAFSAFLGGDDQVSNLNGFNIDITPGDPGQKKDTFHTKIRPGDEIWGVRVGAGTTILQLMVRSA